MMTTSLANVAVIGSGTMGAGIAEVAARRTSGAYLRY
jgi:3-hydroxybutyryl-CoA dehydrogenase